MKPQNFEEVKLILYVKNRGILSDPDLLRSLKESFEEIVNLKLKNTC